MALRMRAATKKRSGSRHVEKAATEIRSRTAMSGNLAHRAETKQKKYNMRRRGDEKRPQPKTVQAEANKAPMARHHQTELFKDAGGYGGTGTATSSRQTMGSSGKAKERANFIDSNRHGTVRRAGQPLQHMQHGRQTQLHAAPDHGSAGSGGTAHSGGNPVARAVEIGRKKGMANKDMGGAMSATTCGVGGDLVPPPASPSKRKKGMIRKGSKFHKSGDMPGTEDMGDSNEGVPPNAVKPIKRDEKVGDGWEEPYREVIAEKRGKRKTKGAQSKKAQKAGKQIEPVEKAGESHQSRTAASGAKSQYHAKHLNSEVDAGRSRGAVAEHHRKGIQSAPDRAGIRRQHQGGAMKAKQAKMHREMMKAGNAVAKATGGMFVPTIYM